MCIYSKRAGANTSMLLSVLEDRREISTMVKSCVAANCSNTYRDGVSLFKFPKDPALRQKWIKNVQRTRAKWSGPSEHSVLCSQHFDSSCFEESTELAAKMGIQTRRKLKPDAVPTLFARPGIQLPSQASEPGPSGLSRLTPRKRASTDSSSLADATSKKSRTAYEKRERSRVSNEIIVSSVQLPQYKYSIL